MGHDTLRLIFVTQTFDERDPILGFVPDWVRALRAHFDSVVVVANEVRTEFADVVSLGKESGAGKLKRGVRYQRVLLRERRSADAILAHMCPIYLDLAAASKMKKLLWFAHPSVTSTLKIAERVADVVLTSLPGSFPLDSKKVRIIGQPIDVARFESVEPATFGSPVKLLALGRISRAKGLDTIVRAVRLLHDVRLRIVGPATTGAERAYRAELQTMVGSDDRVTLEDGVSPDGVPDLYAWCDVLVNGMLPGSGDKVVFEALGAGRLAVVSNPAFTDLLRDVPLDLFYERGDANGLASRIEGIVRAPEATRVAATGLLRERVVRNHSADGWARRVTQIVHETTLR